MMGSGTGDWEAANWTKDRDLLGSTNALWSTGSSDEGAVRPLWLQSNGFENFARVNSR